MALIDFNNQKSFNRGGALLLTLILVGILTTSSLAAGRLMISRQRVTGILEDSSLAYNSAESGIDYALLRFRFDHDADLPRYPDPDDYPKENDTTKYVLRVDITELGTNLEDADTVKIVPENTPITKCADEPLGRCHQYFDLRMWYRTDKVEGLILNRDEGAVFSLPEGNNVGVFELKIDEVTDKFPADGPASGSTFWYAIQWELMGGVGGYKNHNCDDEEIRIRGNKCDINISLLDRETLRLNARGAKFKYNLTVSQRWNPGNPKAFFGGPITHIESVGRYGEAIRKLTLEVDRNSGTILQLFDNVLYSGEGGLK